MLISREFEIGFAHYPKTAGTSLQRWFIETCPDAELLLPENPHYPVALSLRRLRPNTVQRQLRRFTRRGLALLSPKLADRSRPLHESLRIVGVMRDPFEMLVSLFEFWKQEPSLAENTDPFIHSAAPYLPGFCHGSSCRRQDRHLREVLRRRRAALAQNDAPRL